MASYSDFARSNGGMTCTYYIRPALISQSISGNSTTFRSTAYLAVSAGYISWSSGSYSNHTTSGGLGTYYGAGTHVVSNVNVGIGHDAGGVFPELYIGGGISTTFLMNGNCSMTLARGEYATIPRASEINGFTCSNSLLNGVFTYRYTPKLATYFNRLRVSIPNVKAIFSLNLGQKAVAQQSATFSFTAAQLSDILNTIALNAGSVQIGCVIETYSDAGYSAKIGESAELKLSLTVPTAITAPAPTTVDSNAAVTAITGDSAYIIQNKSNLTVRLNAATVTDIATTTKKTTIAKYEITVEGVTKSLTTAGTINFGIVAGDKNIASKLVVTDSRGNKKETPFTILVIPYDAPTVEIVNCFRSNASGVDDATSGTYFTVIAKYSVQSIKIAGVEKNAVSARSIKLGTTVKHTTFSSNVAVTMSGVGTNEYAVSVEVTDKFGTLTSTPSKVNMALVPIAIDLIKRSVGIGGLPTSNDAFEIKFQKLIFGGVTLTPEMFKNTVYDDGK